MLSWLSDKPSCFLRGRCPSRCTWDGCEAAWAVGGDDDSVIAGHGPGHLHLFCAGRARSVPASDPFALARPAKEMPPVTERAPL